MLLCHFPFTYLTDLILTHYALWYTVKDWEKSPSPKVSGLTYKRGAKWKILGGIYSAIYGEVNVSVEKCVEIKGDYVEK